jgi:hypothetical protein
MTLVVELTPYLRRENASDLLTAAANKSKQDLKELLAARFPKSDTLELVQEPTSPDGEATRRNENSVSLAPEPVRLAQAASEPIPPTGCSITPLSPGTFEHRLTVSRETNEKLHYAKDLLGHALPSGKFSDVIDRALDALIARLEQKKFGVTSRARAGSGRKSVSPRHIPTAVRRAIHQRDRGRCTFVSASGRRCDATTRLEFDHETPVARGGQSTTANLRLRCRTHNQYAAEQAYGEEFMRGKREQASAPRAAAPPRKSHETPSETVARSVAAKPIPHEPLDASPPSDDLDVTPWLRKLGYSAAQARAAAERCDELVDATLEQRVRYGLSLLLAPHRKENVRVGGATA